MHIHDTPRRRRRGRSLTPVRVPEDYVPVSYGGHSRGREYSASPITSSQSYDPTPRHHHHSRHHNGHGHHRHHHRSRERFISDPRHPGYVRQRSYSVGALPGVSSAYDYGGVGPQTIPQAQAPTVYAPTATQIPAATNVVGSSYPGQAMAATASAPVGQPPSATVHVPVNDGQGGWIYQTIPPTGTATTTGPLGTGQNMTANAGMNTIPAAAVPTTMPEPQTTYAAQTLPTSGIGYGASQAIPQVQTAPTASASQMYAGETPIGASTMGGSYPTQAAAPESTSMAQPQGNTVVIQPVSDGRGGWAYTMNRQPIPSTNVAMGAVPPMPSYASTVPVGLQSSTGFFSRLFGAGRRAQNVAPQSAYPTYPSTHHHHQSLRPVQHAAARPRYHRRRSIL